MADDTKAERDMLDDLIEGDEDKTDLDKIFEHMTNPDNLLHYTDLTRGEVAAYQVLIPIAKKYDLSALREILVTGLQARISNKRAGRKEVVEITSSRREAEERTEKRGRLTSLLRGRR